MAVIGRQYLLMNRSPEEFELWQESLCIPQALPNALVRFFLDGVKGDYTWGQDKLNYPDGSQFGWPKEFGQKANSLFYLTSRTEIFNRHQFDNSFLIPTYLWVFSFHCGHS